MYFDIGNLIFKLDKADYVFSDESFMDLFICKEKEILPTADIITYQIQYQKLDKYTAYRELQRNIFCGIYETDRGKMLLYPWASCGCAYGFFADDLDSRNDVICYFDPQMKEEKPPISMARFFSTAGMHSKLLWYDAVVLHASYIEWNGKAILFTAPSGVGKSTQASLWAEHEDAEVLNGDRVLLRQTNGIWYAYGYPCCGSSEICVNKTLPVQAIVVLQQGTENRIKQMSLSEKIRSLVTGIQIYVWNEVEMQKSFELSEQIVQSVPIIKLICQPNQNAVLVLKEYLEGMCRVNNN